jgi:hypothetical protein
MSILRGIGRFVYDFIIGDDWKIAAAVVIALAAGLGLLTAGLPVEISAVATAILIGTAFVVAVIVDVQRRDR